MIAPMRVLVVDDSEADRKLLTAMLEVQADQETGLFHQFDEVGTLDQALKNLRDREPYDAILLDLNLPDSEGKTTFQHLHPAARPTPIIIYSGLDDQTLAKQLIAEGASDYIIKVPGLKAKHVLNTLVMTVQRAHYEIRVAQDQAEAVHNAERATKDLIYISSQKPESEIGKEFTVEAAEQQEDFIRHRALAHSVDGIFQILKLQLEKDAKQDEAISTARMRQVSLEEAQRVLARDSVVLEKKHNEINFDLKQLDKKTRLRLTFLGFMLVGGGAGLRDQAPVIWEFLSSFL